MNENIKMKKYVNVWAHIQALNLGVGFFKFGYGYGVGPVF